MVFNKIIYLSRKKIVVIIVILVIITKFDLKIKNKLCSGSVKFGVLHNISSFRGMLVHVKIIVCYRTFYNHILQGKWKNNF